MRLSGTLVLGLCALGLILLTAVGLTLPQPVMGQFGIGYGAPLDRFVLLGCVQGLIYLAAVAMLPRHRATPGLLWLIVGTALLLRLMVLVFPPFLSNDMYRYIWDGWVQAAGINPYRYIPADPHLAFLRDAVVYPNINRANYAHTIYPPAAEMIFLLMSRLAAWLALPPVFTMKLAMVLLEGVGIWALAGVLGRAGLPRSRILIYAWNPVPVWEFAGSGHVDAIAVCFVALALLAAVSTRQGLSAIALAGAVLTKFLPLVLLPAIWRRWDWRFAAIFAAALGLLYAPYLGVGGHVFGFLGGYGTQEGIASGQGLFWLATLGLLAPLPGFAPALYLASLALLLAVLGAAMVFGLQLPAARDAAARILCQRSLLLACVLMAGLSPHYPWYYCWLLIPACVIAWPSTLYLVTATFLLYLNPTHTKLFWPACVYGPFALLAARDLWVTRHPAAPALKGEAIL